MSHPNVRLPGRRRFVFATGAAAIGTLPLARIAHACSQQRAVRLGVILPRSTRYPELAREFLGGLEAFAASDAGRGRLDVIPLACTPGNVPGALVAATEAAQCASVDVVTGIASREHAARLAPALEKHAVPFVACDVGADVVRPRRDSPLLVRHSLGYWQANYAMGEWCAAQLGRRAVIAADFLECGYDIVYAFRRGYEAAGGEIAAVARTGLPNGTETFSEVASAVASTRPDFVYAFYSGRRAEAFLRDYEARGLARTTPLAGGAMLTERAPGAGFDGIITAASWAPTPAGVFAWLGLGAAQRIVAGLDGEASTEAAPPIYVRRLTRGTAGLADVVVNHQRAIEIAPGTHRALSTMVKSGWTHAYLTA
jgi:branched-chain amino acid transport system substrate-binding protein